MRGQLENMCCLDQGLSRGGRVRGEGIFSLTREKMNVSILCMCCNNNIKEIQHSGVMGSKCTDKEACKLKSVPSLLSAFAVNRYS